MTVIEKIKNMNERDTKLALILLAIIDEDNVRKAIESIEV